MTWALDSTAKFPIATNQGHHSLSHLHAVSNCWVG